MLAAPSAGQSVVLSVDPLVVLSAALLADLLAAWLADQ